MHACLPTGLSVGFHSIEATQNYCWRGTGTGVDINRNFDWEFGGPGAA